MKPPRPDIDDLIDFSAYENQPLPGSWKSAVPSGISVLPSGYIIALVPVGSRFDMENVQSKIIGIYISDYLQGYPLYPRHLHDNALKQQLPPDLHEQKWLQN